MKQHTHWILVLLLIALLSACTSPNSTTSVKNEPEATNSSAANAQTEENTAASSKTRIISTEVGDIEVPDKPERIVALYMIGDLLSFDIKPVGISDVYEGAAFMDEVGGIQTLGSWFEPNQEIITALDPDLILVPDKETYEALHKIAPTVIIDAFSQSPEDTILQIGEVIGQQEKATAIVAEFTDHVEQSKQKLADKGLLNKSVTIVEGGNGNMFVVASPYYGRGSQAIYQYLGFKAPDKLQSHIDESIATKNDSLALEVSFEVLGDYIGDFVFRSSYESMVDLSDHVIWTGIPAVKEGRLINIPFGFSYYSDLYSLNKQLDFIVEHMLDASSTQ